MKAASVKTIIGLLAVVLLAAGPFTGCSEQPPEDTGKIASGAVQMDGKWVVALGATQLGAEHLEPPNADDRAYAKKLGPEVLERCLGFLGRPFPPKDNPVQPTVEAARVIGSYLLVDIHYKGGPSDSDEFVVYSTEERRVIGKFIWYRQP